MSRTYSTTGHPVTSYILTGILLSALSATAVAQQNTTYQYQYDANGNLTAVTDPLGHITRYGIDALNRTTTITDANNGITRYSYNGQDRLTAVTDPRSLTTAYTVDGFGHVTQTASPDTGSTASTYDEAGNITSRTDARGKTTQYRYDALNRLVQATHADGSTIAWSYDQGANGIGRLTGITDASGQTSHSYDRRGRRIASSHTIGSGTDLRLYSVLQAYGASGSGTGKRVSMTYPSGNRIDSGYDSNGQLTSLTLTPAGGGAAIPLLTNIGYVPFGPATSWTWGNSTATAVNTHARGIDLDGRTSSYPLGHALMGGSSRTLTHDAASRITAMTHGTASLDQSYGYDSLDRLTAMTANGSSQAYQYDANGNRTQWTVNGASYSNTIGTTSNRLTATSGPAPAASNTYDAAGNLVHDGSIAYGYGDDGRLHSVTIGSDTVTYLIDGMGRRVRKSGPTTLVPTRIVDYVYDESGRLLGEYDAGGKPLQETVYLDDMPVAVVKQVSTGTGTRKTQGTTTQVYYVYADHLNTPRVITRSSDNKMVWRWDQADPFGAQQPDENPSGLGTFTYSLRFPGQVYDKETGLHYNYYRDYDPRTGRYAQSDPIGLRGGSNTYTYVRGNPLRYSDPQGLNPVGGAITGAEIGTIIWPGVGTVAGGVIGAGAGWWIADKISNISLAKPKPGSKPKGCPSGTRPIDQIPGLDKDDVHGIKDGVGAGPRDWTGIAPNGDVITGNSNGDAVNHGPYNDYLP